MNRYIMIRRLRGPAVLLLIGVLALLHEAGVIPYFWSLFWPLLLILAGLLLLAERAVLASEGYPPYAGGPWQGGWQGGPQGAPYAGAMNPAGHGAQQAAGTAMVPSPHDFGNDANGGQQ